MCKVYNCINKGVDVYLDSEEWLVEKSVGVLF